MSRKTETERKRSDNSAAPTDPERLMEMLHSFGYQVLGDGGHSPAPVSFRARQHSDGELRRIHLWPPGHPPKPKRSFLLRSGLEAADWKEKHLITPVKVSVRENWLVAVMPDIPDETLGRSLSRQFRFSLQDAMGILHDILSGLSRLHESGAAHGGLCAECIHLSSDGRARIGNVGISILSDDTATPLHPFRKGKNRSLSLPSARVLDLWIVGTLFHGMITGELSSSATPPALPDVFSPEEIKIAGSLLHLFRTDPLKETYPDVRRLIDAVSRFRKEQEVSPPKKIPDTPENDPFAPFMEDQTEEKEKGGIFSSSQQRISQLFRFLIREGITSATALLTTFLGAILIALLITGPLLAPADWIPAKEDNPLHLPPSTWLPETKTVHSETPKEPLPAPFPPLRPDNRLVLDSFSFLLQEGRALLRIEDYRAAREQFAAAKEKAEGNTQQKQIEIATKALKKAAAKRSLEIKKEIRKLLDEGLLKEARSLLARYRPVSPDSEFTRNLNVCDDLVKKALQEGRQK